MNGAKATLPHIDRIRKVWETVVLFSCLSCHQLCWRGFCNSNPQHKEEYATNIIGKEV